MRRHTANTIEIPQNSTKTRTKRLIDIAFSSILLFFLSPLILAICFFIWIRDGRPIFYTSWRLGEKGRPFLFTKFRTMERSAEWKKHALSNQNEKEKGVLFKISRDPRVTKWGRFLRKSSFDELPQLISVFKGDMSLVGPRPPLLEESAYYSSRAWRRLSVKPGLTGLWQVSGRSDLSFQRQVELDLEYIEKQSVYLDLKILLKTIPVVISGKGAY